MTAGISVAPPRAAAARDVRHRGASARAGRWSLDSSERYRAVFLFGQIIYAKFDAVFRNSPLFARAVATLEPLLRPTVYR